MLDRSIEKPILIDQMYNTFADRLIEPENTLTFSKDDNSAYHQSIALHPAQQHIRDNAKRFNVVACGRRFGKTELAIEELSEVASAGKPTAYFSLTYKQLSDTWRRAKFLLRDITVKVNEQEKRLELRGGGSIDFWSLESADSALGRKYARIVIDEAAIVRDAEAWPLQIRPMLADYQGDAFFFSTPRGHNWFWQLWVMGNDPTQTDWKSFKFPTAANPYIAPEEVESAKSLLPARLFEQEYLAEFTDDAGGVFRGVADVSIAIPLSEPVPGRKYVAGLDWGKDNDFTVLSIWDQVERREVYLDRFNQINWSLQRGRVVSAWQRFGLQAIIAESNSIGGPNIEALLADGIPVQPFATTGDTKGPLIESLALAVERKECMLLADPTATAEMQAYELERLPSGRFRYGAPAGMHDDTVIARALAWRGVYFGGPSISFAIHVPSRRAEVVRTEQEEVDELQKQAALDTAAFYNRLLRDED